jgi:parallel beta-helix repeat protein
MLTARRCTLLLLSSLLLAGLGAAIAPAAEAAVACDRYASPTGDDGASGAAAAPLRTVSKLVGGLTAGQTGCLLPGTYTEDVKVESGGAPGAPITLAAGPQGGATLVGRLWVADSANDVVVRDLTLDGRNAGNLPSPTVNGDRVSFIGNDVSNGNTTICFDIGSVIGYGAAHNVLLDGNRIHNCGILPPQNHHHGVFLENSQNGVVRGNAIFDNADKGILVFPDSDGNLIEHNVIDGNSTGILIGGSMLGDPWHRTYPKDNLVRRNVISNSRRYNVEGYWEWQPPADVNNVVTDNCLFGAGFGIQVQEPAQVSQWGAGFTAPANRVADPSYVNRPGKVFDLASSSGCGGFGPATFAATPGPTPASPSGPPASPSAPPPPAGAKPAEPTQKAKPRVRSDEELRIAFVRRPRLVRPGKLSVRIAAAANSRVVFVVRSRGRILGVVRTRSDARGTVRRVLTIQRRNATRLRVTASVRRDRQLRRTTLAVRLTPREVRLLARR